MLKNKKSYLSLFNLLLKITPISRSTLDHLSVSKSIKQNLMSDWTETAFDFDEAIRRVHGEVNAKQKPK